MNYNYTKNLVNLAKKITVYTVMLALLATIFAPVSGALAQIQEPLVISNITITRNDDNATISWHTNRQATGKVEYGTSPDNYQWTLNTNLKTFDQAITIFGLNPETDYYFRIFAEDDYSEVSSFEQNFETLKDTDNRAPLISKVTVAYVTGNTATFQWETDEEANSTVEYGMTTAYGRSVSDGHRTKIHDITITGLVDGTFYHFRVKSADKNNNVSKWYDMTFRTNLTSNTDKDALIIYNIEPSSNNDVKITETSAVISWRTNKLSQGWVRYGKSTSYGSTIATSRPRDFVNSATLTGLTPGTTYYFDIKSRDVLGKEVSSAGHSFTTKSSNGTTGNTTVTFPSGSTGSTGTVLGASTCSVNLNTDFGHWGYYYNLPESHPDMETWKQNVKVAGANDWYSDRYFDFDQIDTNLRFGNKFYPVNGNLPGDPNHFAVYWRAMVYAPTTGSYSYDMRSDDDSWLLINGGVVTDLHGVHEAKSHRENIELNAGWHLMEIYYADRQTRQAEFNFTPDSDWKIHPLPIGCTIQNVLDYNSSGSAVGGGFISGGASGTGTILGASNTDNGFSNGSANFTPAPAYACDPNLGYTKITALYKTTDSPDIWAILETGQKHYITSPESFNLYRCDWSRVKTVSRSKLNSYANATLVRTPSNATIYHLFDRPLTKWLKINMPSPTVFVSYSKNYWGNVARINHLDIASYPDVKLIKEENSSGVYLIEGNNKRLFSSEQAFESKGYDWAEVANLNQIHLDSYTNGASID